MILFFRSKAEHILAVNCDHNLTTDEINALNWLFSGTELVDSDRIEGTFIGPRREMITPWSTTAVEITRNMNISGISRIEEYFSVPAGKADSEIKYDKMLQRIYHTLDQKIYTIDKQPDPVEYITDFETYNLKEGLALSKDEIQYLKDLSTKLKRPLTDSEVFGFSQVNSEHCRHKIFNGTFIIDGVEMESTLFKMIKKTSQTNPGRIVSAYKDNCAFIEGPKVRMFYPATATKPDFFKMKEEKTVISLKAETHNFPTTVEPFNGAATGSGGEIRDRIAGGKGSFPIAGTACYMTAYPRFEETAPDGAMSPEEAAATPEGIAPRTWEQTEGRPWLYQTPQQILTKASNGASDFGNKFGQPLICGSLDTLEHIENDPDGTTRQYGYDKVIMLAGGVGFAKRKDSLKETPVKGDKIVLLGGDNYRIGMGGGAVSSVNTGEYANAIELNAVQRSNPEMQKRVYNAIRALSEKDHNTIVSVHDHGAGGHLNCLSELVEENGGNINIDALPIGDPTLSLKEIIGNESQERMGIAMKSSDTEELRKIAERERAPFYVVGEVTGEKNFTLKDAKSGISPIDMQLEDMFGSTPKSILVDHTPTGGADGKGGFSQPSSASLDGKTPDQIKETIEKVLQIESVACKDWLTNKVDRSVTGLVACQQCCGEIQLPLNDLGITAIGYDDVEGIATSMGHAPAVALINPAAGSRMSIAEALTNVVWTPIKNQLDGVSLSANWMWPGKNEGEDARLYSAVEAASDFAIALGINIPTGKDSMSMTQKYPDGRKVIAPGTLIISTVGESMNVGSTIHPAADPQEDSVLLYIPFTKAGTGAEAFPLGGTAYAQTEGFIGTRSADVDDPAYFRTCFNSLQDALFSPFTRGNVLAGHDISAGGLVTTLLEMNFPNTKGGMKVDLTCFGTADILVNENPGVVVQVKASGREAFIDQLSSSVDVYEIGTVTSGRTLEITYGKGETISLDIDRERDVWFRTSYLLEKRQTPAAIALERYKNYKKQPLLYSFPKHFTGAYTIPEKRKVTAAIIREKGSQCDRETAWALYAAGFAVKDVHVTDLVSGRETLDDVQFIVFVGGFSNADTLGSAKGWAGALLYNEKARKALERFYSRKDTLSLGICNGCQLMGELGLVTSDMNNTPKLQHNDSHKFESEFTSVTVESSPAILLSSLQGSKLGIWIAHGEGKFSLPENRKGFKVALRYNYNDYPANPNGSPEGIAGLCSEDGRHLMMMPHPERGLRPWNWAWYPKGRENDVFTPWIELFVNGRVWIEKMN